MATATVEREPAKADYLEGDPMIPGPISGGVLAIDSAGLRFTHGGEAELEIGIDDLAGITVSGSGGRKYGVRRREHGTTSVAVRRGERPMIWRFGIDRSRGVVLRDQINRVLAGMGRPPLPFVEALYDFDPAEPVFAEKPPKPLPTVEFDALPEVNGDAWYRKRRYIFAIAAAMLLLEIGLPLLILFVL